MNDQLITFLVIVLLLSTVNDVQFKRIPNLIIYSAMVISFLHHSFSNGLHGIAFSLSGLALGICLFLIPYLKGGLGAGDVKLMGAVGAVIGPKGVFIASLYTGMAGGIYAAILFLIHRDHGRSIIGKYGTMLKVLVVTGHLTTVGSENESSQPKLCFAVAIASGTFLYLILSAAGYQFPF